MYDAAARRPVSGGPVQEVRSAEQVALYFPLAGPGTRILAYAVDWAVLAAIQLSAIVALLLTTPLARRLSDAMQPLFERAPGEDMVSNAVVIVVVAIAIGQLLFEWAYFTVSERLTGGRSIGKRVVGLRVIGADGLPLTPRASLVRNLLRAVDVLPGSYVTGLVSIVVSPKCQRLGDLAAGTIVVRHDAGVPLELPIELAEGEPGGDAVFRFSHAQIARLGGPERQLLRQTLRRVEALAGDQAAAALARSVEVLRTRLGYEPVAAGQRRAFLRALLRAIERG